MTSPLAVKLALAPALIAFVSLLQRRLGPAIGGLLTGMPLASGPVLLVLALDFGPQFASEAAAGGVQALTAVAVLAAVYATAAVRWRLSWAASLSIAFTAYAATMWMIMLLPMNLVSSLVLTTFMQWVAVRTMPARRGIPDTTRAGPPSWDIPLRMLLSATLVWTIAAVAERAGARLSGLLAPFPVFTTVLTVFTHQHDGPAAAAGFLRGLLIGMSSLAIFFAVSAAVLPTAGTWIGLAAATIASMMVSAALWWFSRPPQ